MSRVHPGNNFHGLPRRESDRICSDSATKADALDGDEELYWIDAMRQRRKLVALQKSQERYSEEIGKAIETAERDRDRDQYDAMVSEYLHETDLFENEIARLETQFLLRAARRYMIPVSPTKDETSWRKSRVDGKSYLTIAAMRDLRNSIREERRLRAEPITIWLSLAIGLLGAITGLVSVL